MTFNQWLKDNYYELHYNQEPLYLKDGKDYSTHQLLKMYEEDSDFETPKVKKLQVVSLEVVNVAADDNELAGIMFTCQAMICRHIEKRYGVPSDVEVGLTYRNYPVSDKYVEAISTLDKH